MGTTGNKRGVTAGHSRGFVCPWFLTGVTRLGRSMPARTPPVEDAQVCGDDSADEIMERIVRSATQGPGTRAQPRERRRSRANRKSREGQRIFKICI